MFLYRSKNNTNDKHQEKFSPRKSPLQKKNKNKQTKNRWNTPVKIWEQSKSNILKYSLILTINSNPAQAKKIKSFSCANLRMATIGIKTDELQSFCYADFLSNILGKGMKPPILPIIG